MADAAVAHPAPGVNAATGAKEAAETTVWPARASCGPGVATAPAPNYMQKGGYQMVT